MIKRSAVAGLLGLLLLVPNVQAHVERASGFPSGKGHVPKYRTSGSYLVVCKPDTPQRIAKLPPELRAYNERLYSECRERGFQHIQAAVNAVKKPGTRILIQPGVYREQPSLAKLSEACKALEERRPLTYEQQRACPHLDNLVAIFGDGPDRGIACDGPMCDLQMEGTGAKPLDVILDNNFNRLNGLRADRADGIYFRNFTVQRSEFNAVYIIQADGFVIDRMIGRWNDEYGFLTYASDHGLYTHCEAYVNGDGGLYPGSAAELHGSRTSIEVQYCRSHHNLLGFSGTAGNSVYVHDNRFYKNTTGIVVDSLATDHPGDPQDSGRFVNNYMYDNNQDYFRYARDGTCQKPLRRRGIEDGVVCPTFPAPVGVGMVIAGGNANVLSRNYIYDNWRYGVALFWVPAYLRGDEEPEKQFDTSHFNRFVNNTMGVTPSGKMLRNGMDFWWDQEGMGNCWLNNFAPEGITSDPLILPSCDGPVLVGPWSPVKTASIAPCAFYDRETNPDPPGCPWLRRPDRP
ncbi:MAG: right-handed parallel beta-helix repeat-containing protein [Actinomycetota bacterium]